VNEGEHHKSTSQSDEKWLKKAKPKTRTGAPLTRSLHRLKDGGWVGRLRLITAVSSKVYGTWILSHLQRFNQSAAIQFTDYCQAWKNPRSFMFSVNRESRCQTPSEWTWKSAEQRSKTSVATAIGPWFCGRSLSGKTNPKNLNKAIQGRGRVSLHSIDTKSKTLENIIDRKVTDRQTDHMSVGYRFYEKTDRQAKEKKMTKRERYKIELQ